MFNSVPRVKVCSLLALTATAVIASFFSVGYYPGEDVTFHMGFWFEVARQWHEGILYVRWAAQSMYGYGNPTMIFYPPMDRILGGALVACLPSRLALGTYAWLGLVLGGFGFFHLCREFFDDRSSLVAAFAYVINPYNLFVLYMRSALGEFLAAALFPWFILAVYRLAEKRKRSLPVLALLIALLWITNPPAGVIANYAAAIIVATLAWVRRSKSLLGLFLLAEILGAGLAAFYVVPAWRQQPLINVGNLRHVGLSADFLLSKLSIWALKNEVLLTTGFLWQVAVGALAWFEARKVPPQRREIFVAFTTILVVSAFMCLPFSFIVWKYAPFLSYVQFPWRWLFPLNLAVAFFIAAALSQSERRSWLPVAACTYSLLLILSFSAVRKRALDWNAFAAPFQSGVIYDDEDYIPKAAGVYPEEGPRPTWLPSPRIAVLDGSGQDRPSLLSQETPAESANLTRFAVQSWQTESRIFTVNSPQPARVRVRLFYYPGWHVWVNGTEVEEVERDDHDAVVVRVPSGHSRVQLVFKNTPDETWGMIISALVAILVATLYLSQVNRQGHRRVAV
ncbi:MAG TPA: 6-pyruvoyl-tetrahydropterin synthase-related protein [Terriglobia bacterium]|nr:6-pyruvoyl-tetrahydropterin synthase-related protein [Terriglobia bacterium]